jgi:8-oxo-dGTP diphosphatase
MSSFNIVHVAVAVIKNQHGQFFIAKRPEKSHQGGLWEFPGGKIENGESVLEALARELFEEVGITVLDASPLIRIHHNYADKSVLLDVWCINEFSGEAHGKEGQETCWINLEQFSEYTFPEANSPIIKALNLPDKYMITGEFSSEENLLKKIQIAIKTGLMMIQFRAPGLDYDTYFNYAGKIYDICKRNNVKLLLNTSFENYIDQQAFKFSHGLHLNSQAIHEYPSVQDNIFLTSTSVHNNEELLLAEQKDIDFILLSPVKKTLSHPGSKPLGWTNFREITEITNLPVYALGGMTVNDIETAKTNGGQGIAAIGEFWNI